MIETPPRFARCLPARRSMPDYQNTLFLSHRWLTPGWTEWIRSSFLPVLEEVLAPSVLDLKNRPIWWDDKEPATGESWPRVVAEKLAGSPVMIALLCPNYFARDSWGLCEYEMMLFREEQAAEGGSERPCLIVPIVIFELGNLAAVVGERLMLDLAKIELAGPYCVGKKYRAKLFKELKRSLGRQLVKHVKNAPDHDPKWLDLHFEALQKRLEEITRAPSEDEPWTAPWLNPDLSQRLKS